MNVDDSGRASRGADGLRDARIAVTGASGFIGSHLCDWLEAGGAHVVALRRPDSRRDAPSSGAVTLDLHDRAAIAHQLARIKPDIVFHLGGFVSGDRSAEAMKRAFDGNVIPTSNLLFGCADVLPRCRVVAASSLDASNPWQSRAETGSPYGVSKLQVEILAGAFRMLLHGNVICARIGMVYGPNDPNGERLVPGVISSLLAGVSPRVSSGARRCDFVHVSDVVGGLLTLAIEPNPTLPCVDLGTGLLASIRDVAEALRELVDSSVALTYDRSLDRPYEQERAADIVATRAATGWYARFELGTGLADTVRWYRARRVH